MVGSVSVEGDRNILDSTSVSRLGHGARSLRYRGHRIIR